MLQISTGAARKVIESAAGQRRAGPRWTRWAHSAELHNVRIWVHAPSVGEALVADPVLVRLARSLGQPLTAVRTYTSPSAVNWPSGFHYDRSDFLPSPNAVGHTIEAIRPSLILYPRADLWPTLVSGAAKADIPQIIIGGSVRGDSLRLKWPARAITARMVGHMAAIGAVREADAGPWQRLGASPARIRVTGDPRDDQVLDRFSDIRWVNALLPWAGGEFVLLAASTHPADEEAILRATNRIDGRILVVPHDATPSNIERLARSCRRTGLRHTVWRPGGAGPDDAAKLLIVNASGGLQDLYALASAAYVGGGFGGNRIHSLAEPAAVGVPILVGPGARMDPSAARFLQSGGASLVRSADAIASLCSQWMTNDEKRKCAGLRARAELTAGAARRTVELILPYLEKELA